MDNEHYYHQHTHGYIGYTAGGLFADPLRVAQVTPKIAASHIQRPQAGGRQVRAVTGLDAKEKDKKKTPPKKGQPKKKGKDQKGKPKDPKNSQKQSKPPDKGADKGEQEQRTGGWIGGELPIALDVGLLLGGAAASWWGGQIGYTPLTVGGLAVAAVGAYLTAAYVKQTTTEDAWPGADVPMWVDLTLIGGGAAAAFVGSEIFMPRVMFAGALASAVGIYFVVAKIQTYGIFGLWGQVEDWFDNFVGVERYTSAPKPGECRLGRGKWHGLPVGSPVDYANYLKCITFGDGSKKKKQ